MGKSLPSVPKLNKVAKIVTSSSRKLPQQRKTEVHVSTPQTSKPSSIRADSASRLKPTAEMESRSSGVEGKNRVRLAHVVSDCVNRWFLDALKVAKSGDVQMQLLVGQMYNTGYGCSKDPKLGRAWINRAIKGRSEALKASENFLGDEANDSDGQKDN